MIKKLVVLSFLLGVVIASPSFAGGIVTAVSTQHFYGVTDGVAVSVKYIGTSSYGGSVTFTTAGTGCTFYAAGAVDSDVGASGVLTWASQDDTDQVHTVMGFKEAVERSDNWKVTIVNAMDTDSPSLIFDTSTLTIIGGEKDIYFQGIFSAASAATGEETRSYDQIRINCRSGERVRLQYSYASATGGTLRIYDATTGVEEWRSATSATPSIDFTPEGQDYDHDIVVRYRETGDLPFTTGEFMQVRYQIVIPETKQ